MKRDVVYNFPEDLDEAMRFHGLTEEKMHAGMIRWMGSIKMESPRLYELYNEGPERIESHIIKYDFALNTNVDVDYAYKRGWDAWMGFREIIQNALDIEEKVFGYDNIAINVERVGSDVYVYDRGHGVGIDAFKFGGTPKGCAERGRFGEGLKIGVACFEAMGSKVYIFTKSGAVYKTVRIPEEGIIHIAVGRFDPKSIMKGYGTVIVITDASIRPEDVGTILFQKYVETQHNIKILSRKDFPSRECNVDKPHFIVASTDLNEAVDKLWVRDIFVNHMGEVVDKPSLFGYNLWWVDLDPNRTSVEKKVDIEITAAEAYTEEAIIHLLNLLHNEADGKLETGWFETDLIDWRSADNNVKKRAADWVRDHGYSIETDSEKLKWYDYYGVDALLIPENMEPLFVFSTRSETILNRILDIEAQEAERNIFDDDQLTVRERINLAAAKYTIDTLIRKTRKILEENESPFERTKLEWPEVYATILRKHTSGVYVHEGAKIYLAKEYLSDKEKILGTVVHECAHHIGVSIHGDAPDVSEEFESALTLCAGFLVNLATDSKFTAFMTKILRRGCFNARDYATVTEIIEMLDDEIRVDDEENPLAFFLDDFKQEILKSSDYIMKNAPIVIVGIEGEDGVFRLVCSDYSPIAIMELDEPFSRIDYKRSAIRAAELLLFSYKYETAKRYVTLLYDVEKDRYVIYNGLTKLK